MTETTGAATYLPPQDHDMAGNERMRSAGKPYPGVELKVVDEDGKPVPARSVGEICIKSKANMLGYWNLPDATAKTLIDGYVHTGDAGYLDEDGYVYVHDRVKDMIVSGGENIYPAEVENALFGHPAVADVAVIGVPDDRWGEAVKAIVVLKPGQNGDRRRPDRFRAHPHRRLQTAEDDRLHRRVAAQSVRQGAQARIAQAVLGRPRTPGELTPRR